MPGAIPNGETKDIRFLLSVETGDPIFCVADYGIAGQIASTLGAALDLLRAGLIAEGAAVPIPAQELREIRIQKSLLEEIMIIELITTMGIPFVFQFPVRMAEALSDRLKNEAGKDHQIGRA